MLETKRLTRRHTVYKLGPHLMRELLSRLADSIPGLRRSHDLRGDSPDPELAARVRFYEESIDHLADELQELAPRRRQA